MTELQYIDLSKKLDTVITSQGKSAERISRTEEWINQKEKSIDGFYAREWGVLVEGQRELRDDLKRLIESVVTKDTFAGLESKVLRVEDRVRRLEDETLISKGKRAAYVVIAGGAGGIVMAIAKPLLEALFK